MASGLAVTAAGAGGGERIGTGDVAGLGVEADLSAVSDAGVVDGETDVFFSGKYSSIN